MRRFSLARASLVVLTILAATMPQLSRAVDAVRPKAPVAPSNIVIGFVGGFVRHDNPHQGPVQFAQQIQRTVPKDTYVRVFENRRRKQAYETILHLLDVNRDGVLSAEEKLEPVSFSSATAGERPRPCRWPATCSAKAFRLC